MRHGNEPTKILDLPDTPDRPDAPSNPDKPDRPRLPDDKHPHREINVLVNEHSVKLIGRRHTGREIKEAAIRAEVKIELDFVLSVEYESSRRKIVGDTDVIEVREGMRFVAIADDDNS